MSPRPRLRYRDLRICEFGAGATTHYFQPGRPGHLDPPPTAVISWQLPEVNQSFLPELCAHLSGHFTFFSRRDLNLTSQQHRMITRVTTA